MNDKKWTWLAVAMLAALAPAVAFAGHKESFEVTCSGNGATGTCYGMLLAAQNSTDDDQEIFCETTSRRGVATRDVYCFAEVTGGLQRTCRSTASTMADVAAAANFESLLSFTWSGGDCISITVRNTSTAAPF